MKLRKIKPPSPAPSIKGRIGGGDNTKDSISARKRAFYYHNSSVAPPSCVKNTPIIYETLLTLTGAKNVYSFHISRIVYEYEVEVRTLPGI